MSFTFSKELAQSSLKSSDEQSLLSLNKFINKPRTLYDEIGQQEQDFYLTPKSAQENSEQDWKNIILKLQVENASLVDSLKQVNQDLMQSRREKEELEKFIQRQAETTDKIVSRFIKNQKEEALVEKDKNQILDLIFQKKYLLMENSALKESQQEVHDYYGIQIQDKRQKILKWRSIVYALIALQRFQKKL